MNFNPRKIIFASIFLFYKLNWRGILLSKSFFNAIRSDLGNRLNDSFISLNENRTQKIIHQSKKGDSYELQFYVPNGICSYRVKTFSSKEPETLEWIDEFGGGIFFDIGANIGLYSIYYAMTKGNSVYAFEPSFFNTKQLSKNVYLNQTSHLVNVVSTPLSSVDGVAPFTLSTTQEGGALSSFGVKYGQDGKDLNEKLSYATLGFSLDTLSDLGVIPPNPSLVKIDVDGIEDLILKGGMATFSNPACKSILVEVNPSFSKQLKGVERGLYDAGYVLRNPRDSLSRDGYNQIWVKK